MKRIFIIKELLELSLERVSSEVADELVQTALNILNEEIKERDKIKQQEN